MVTIEEKLNVFTKLVLEKVQQEYDQKMKEITLENRGKREVFREQLEKRVTKYIDHMENKGLQEKNKMIAKAYMEKHKKILNKKQECIQRILHRLQIQAGEFTRKEEYRMFLLRLFKQVLRSFDKERLLKIYLTKEDLERYREMLLQEAQKQGYQREQIQIEEAQENLIGGMIVVAGDGRFQVNGSLVFMIEEKRDWIGQRIYAVLEKAGEQDE